MVNVSVGIGISLDCTESFVGITIDICYDYSNIMHCQLVIEIDIAKQGIYKVIDIILAEIPVQVISTLRNPLLCTVAVALVEAA